MLFTRTCLSSERVGSGQLCRSCSPHRLRRSFRPYYVADLITSIREVCALRAGTCVESTGRLFTIIEARSAASITPVPVSFSWMTGSAGVPPLKTTNCPFSFIENRRIELPGLSRGVVLK